MQSSSAGRLAEPAPAGARRARRTLGTPPAPSQTWPLPSECILVVLGGGTLPRPPGADEAGSLLVVCRIAEALKPLQLIAVSAGRTAR